MPLVYSSDDISWWEKHFANGFVLGEGKTANMISVLFRTKKDVVRRLLPPLLEPYADPIGEAYVVEFPKTNFWVSYNEAAVSLFAQYKGVMGRYCLSMPVTDDTALIGGREIYGFPKKIAEEINLQKDGDDITGMCMRKGVRIIEIKANMTGIGEVPKIRPLWYLVKWFRHPNLRHYGWPSESSELFDYPPRLIRWEGEIDYGKIQSGKGQLKFGESQFDPLHEIPVEEVLEANYFEGMEIRMPPGQVVAEMNSESFRPYVFLR